MNNRSQPGRRLENPRGHGSVPEDLGGNVSIQPSMGEEPSKPSANRDLDATSVMASLSTDLKDAANTARRAVKEQASEFAAGVGDELAKTAESQKARGVDAIRMFARAITSAAAELEGQSPRVAQSVRHAAKKVEGLSENISRRNVDELVKAAADLARSQPMLFVGGAVAAGFAMSRFLKSSSSTSKITRDAPNTDSATGQSRSQARS